MLQISSLFSDGAVLCRRKELRVFGGAESGARVHCELRDERNALLCQGDGLAAEGKFLILLPPQEPRTDCMLIITDGSETFTARNIAIGEVFLAGGQSNMELELQNADEGQTLIAEHENPLVRYFNVPKFSHFCAEREEAWGQQRWHEIRPGEGKDMSAVAYFFAMKLQQHLQVPVGIIDSYWGGTSVTCWMDEDWLRRTGEGTRYLEEYAEKTRDVTMAEYLEKEKVFQRNLNAWNDQMAGYKAEHPGCEWEELVAAIGPCPWEPPMGPASPHRPAGLYETMIAPLLPLALTGMLYYQGEEDTWRTKQYDVLMTSLIARWRTAFRDEQLPFLFVQLPMWIEKGAADSKNWPALRLRQSETRDRVRNSGMVCLLDQGEFDNIHPTNKRVVGERMFETARRVIYGEQGKASPRIIGKRADGQTLALIADQPLKTLDGNDPVLLELAGADGAYLSTRAAVEGSELRIKSAGVEYPLYARYAWTDYGMVNIFGENGLPLEPFEI